MIKPLSTILSEAKSAGIAYNSVAGGQYVLCATEDQLLKFVTALCKLVPNSAAPAQWIPVDDFEPKLGQRMLAYHDHWPVSSDHPYLVVRTDIGWLDARRGKYMGKPTHWMPLPAPPAIKEEAK